MKNFLSSTKGKIIAGAATLVVIAAVIVTVILLNTGYRNIRVEDLNGTSKVTSGVSVNDAFKGQNLKSGEKVEVFEQSFLALALDSDKHVIANELTKFRLEATGVSGKDSRTVIRLETGSITNEIDNKLLPSESYVVESPNATMSVRGTVFSVNVYFDDEGLCHTVVEVEQGVVEFAEKGTDNDEVRTLNAGETAEVISRVDEINNENLSVNSDDSSSVGGNSGGSGQTLIFGDFEYIYNEKLGGIEIKGYKGNDEIVSVPAEIDGEKVVKIGDYSFLICDGLTNITIPDGVTEIGREVFYDCHKLTSVSLPDSVTSIGVGAFFRCGNLTDIEIPKNVTYIGKNAFYDCNSIKNLVIPEGVTVIEEGVFESCEQITSITIPNGVTRIVAYAFRGCYGLTSLEIPDSVTEIGYQAFYGGPDIITYKGKTYTEDNFDELYTEKP